MNVYAMYIPKSQRGFELARLLDLPRRKVCGRYVGNVCAHLTPELAAKIAYILDSVGADAEETDALERAAQMRADPVAGGLLPEDAEKCAAALEAGAWALGYR